MDLNKEDIITKFMNIKNLDLEKTDWINYQDTVLLSINDEADLISIFKESNLNNINIHSKDYKLLGLHAWRSLSQLKSIKALEIFFNSLFSEENEDAGKFRNDFPKIIEHYEIEALPLLEKYLFKVSQDTYLDSILFSSIVEIYYANKKVTDKCTQLIRRYLKDYKKKTKEDINYLIEIIAPLNTKIFSDIILAMLKDNIIDFQMITWNMVENLVPTDDETGEIKG